MPNVKSSADPHMHPQTALYERYASLSRIPHPTYAHAMACFAEYLATTFFLFLALSGEQVAYSAAQTTGTFFTAVDTVLFSSLSYAVAFIASSWIFFRITSGLFNPAVTVGMWVIGSLTWLRALLIIVAQFLGAMTAAGLVSVIFPGALVPSMQLGAGTSTARGFFIELFLTMCFVLMVFGIAGERHRYSNVVPFGLGFALLSVTLSSMLFTGGSLNPARAFAVALASHKWPTYHWIYWLAPVLGCVPAGWLYGLIRALEQETADIKHRKESAAAPASATRQSSADVEGHQLAPVPEHAIEKMGSGA